MENTVQLLAMISLLVEGDGKPIELEREGHIIIFWDNLDITQWKGTTYFVNDLRLKEVTAADISVIPSFKVEEAGIDKYFDSRAQCVRALLSTDFSDTYSRLCSQTFELLKFAAEALIQSSRSMREMMSSFYFIGSLGVRILKISAWNPDYRLEVLDCLWNFSVFWCRCSAEPGVMRKERLHSLSFLAEITDNSEFLEFMDSETFLDMRNITSTLARMTRDKNSFEPPIHMSDQTVPRFCLRTPFGGPNCTYLFSYRQIVLLRSLQRVEERCLKTAFLGRVLCETLPSDQKLALLSKKAPLASIKWQKGRLVGRGAYGSVYFFNYLNFHV